MGRKGFTPLKRRTTILTNLTSESLMVCWFKPFCICNVSVFAIFHLRVTTVQTLATKAGFFHFHKKKINKKTTFRSQPKSYWMCNTLPFISILNFISHQRARTQSGRIVFSPTPWRIRSRARTDTTTYDNVTPCNTLKQMDCDSEMMERVGAVGVDRLLVNLVLQSGGLFLLNLLNQEPDEDVSPNSSLWLRYKTLEGRLEFLT